MHLYTCELYNSPGSANHCILNHVREITFHGILCEADVHYLPCPEIGTSPGGASCHLLCKDYQLFHFSIGWAAVCPVTLFCFHRDTALKQCTEIEQALALLKLACGTRHHLYLLAVWEPLTVY